MRNQHVAVALALAIACGGEDSQVGSANDAGKSNPSGPSSDGGVVADASRPGDSGDAASSDEPWADVPGVPGASLRARASTGDDDALIFYGGCGASTSAVRGFADAIAANPAWKRPLRHLIAVKWTSSGCGYDGTFKNSVLGPRLLERVKNTGRVTVLAHSSGAYVAREWIAQALAVTTPAWDPQRQLRDRIAYFNLDGGGDGNLNLIEQSGAALSIFFVGAKDASSNLVSRNYSTMKALGGGTRFIEVDARGSGCEAANCMHDAVITTVPHNKKSFVDAQGTSKPLWCDYASFPSQPDASCAAIDEQRARAGSRSVVTSYLSRL